MLAVYVCVCVHIVEPCVNTHKVWYLMCDDESSGFPQ